IKIDLEDLNLDLASISAHKIGGPQGVGAVLIRKGIDISAINYGGFQENRKRAGTHNVAGIVGFGEICKIAVDNLEKYQKTAQLKAYLEQKLQEIAGNNLVIFSQEAERLPNTSFIATKGINNQTQLMYFDLNNIAVSIGSACSSGSSKPSRVLEAMKIDKEISKTALRISLSLE